MAKATGLISSLFNVAVSQDVPFASRNSFNACIMVQSKLIFFLRCAFIPFSTTVSVTICGTHSMALTWISVVIALPKVFEVAGNEA